MARQVYWPASLFVWLTFLIPLFPLFFHTCTSETSYIPPFPYLWFFPKASHKNRMQSPNVLPLQSIMYPIPLDSCPSQSKSSSQYWLILLGFSLKNEFTFGLDDIRGLFQPKWLYDSVIHPDQPDMGPGQWCCLCFCESWMCLSVLICVTSCAYMHILVGMIVNHCRGWDIGPGGGDGVYRAVHCLTRARPDLPLLPHTHKKKCFEPAIPPVSHGG